MQLDAREEILCNNGWGLRHPLGFKFEPLQKSNELDHSQGEPRGDGRDLLLGYGSPIDGPPPWTMVLYESGV